jgi:hypothetical protein
VISWFQVFAFKWVHLYRYTTAGKKKVRPIFKGTPREAEPPQPIGVREDSFQQVMLGGAYTSGIQLTLRLTALDFNPWKLKCDTLVSRICFAPLRSGGAESDLPAPEVVAAAVASIPTLVGLVHVTYS